MVTEVHVGKDLSSVPGNAWLKYAELMNRQMRKSYDIK